MKSAFAHLNLSREERTRFDERYAHVLNLHLRSGGHPVGDEMCAMEAAAYIAGDPWSDAPQCVCPTIREFMVGWNDSLPTDAARDRLLKPLLPKVLGTRSSEELAARRSFMAFDWLVRDHLPTWLELVEELRPAAAEFRNLPAIVDVRSAVACGESLKSAADRANAAWAAARAAARAAAWAAARDAAWDAAWAAARAAAWAAARDAAWDAAWAAARAAAWDAAWDAAWAAARAAARAAAWDAAWAAARDAAWAAAWDAAWAAARAAAWDALKPTTERLQASAQELVLRMCAAK